MERIVGVVVGLAAGVAVAGVNLRAGAPVEECVVRAAIASVLGYWIGRLVLGRSGLEIARQAAGPLPPPAPEGKPPSPAPATSRRAAVE